MQEQAREEGIICYLGNTGDMYVLPKLKVIFTYMQHDLCGSREIFSSHAFENMSSVGKISPHVRDSGCIFVLPPNVSG